MVIGLVNPDFVIVQLLGFPSALVSDMVISVFERTSKLDFDKFGTSTLNFVVVLGGGGVAGGFVGEAVGVSVGRTGVGVSVGVSVGGTSVGINVDVSVGGRGVAAASEGRAVSSIMEGAPCGGG
jgi:hypothetical protein